MVSNFEDVCFSWEISASSSWPRKKAKAGASTENMVAPSRPCCLNVAHLLVAAARRPRDGELLSSQRAVRESEQEK